MNWDRIEGQWKQRRGRAVRHWGRMMNDELAGVAGKYEQLVGELQERYGSVKEEAMEQMARFREIAGDLKQVNKKLTDLLESMPTATRLQNASKRKPRRHKGRPGTASPKRK